VKSTNSLNFKSVYQVVDSIVPLFIEFFWGLGLGGKVLSLDDKRALVVVLSFCGLERERDASAT
jgi:hypothetical protein